MGAKPQTVGGGAATPLANDFLGWLQQGLQTGSFGGGTAGQNAAGANPVSSTMGISGVLNDLLMGGAGNVGGAMGQMIAADTERQADMMRARFGAQGGTAFGTGAQHAEGVMRAEQAPKLASTIGAMQMQALQPLMAILAQMTGMGTPQAGVVMQENPWVTGAQSVAGLMQGASNIKGIGQPAG